MKSNSLSKIKEEIRAEADLCDDTFLFLLYKEGKFDGGKYFALVDCILEVYERGAVDTDIKKNVCLFLRAVQLCIVSHLDANDFYKIEKFDMTEWAELYRDKFDEVLEIAVLS